MNLLVLVFLIFSFKIRPELCENQEKFQISSSSSKKVCNLKKDMGTCSDYTVKYFYDSENGACSRFWYGGCDGNENRFESAKECEIMCALDRGASEICSQPPEDAGECDNWVIRYSYEASSRSCKAYYYGGCGGNANRFETAEECESKCTEERSTQEPSRISNQQIESNTEKIISKPSQNGVQNNTKCEDDKNFANCNLIVSGNYCNHKYYRVFCCKSCTLAEQLR